MEVFTDEPYMLVRMKIRAPLCHLLSRSLSQFAVRGPYPEDASSQN